MAKPVHLAFILNFTPDDWRGPFGNGGAPWDGQFYVEVAQALERAKFDFVIVEDKLMVPASFGGSQDRSLRLGSEAPKHDPIPLAVAMGLATRKLGIAATISTLTHHPFVTARLSSTIDSLIGGRFGWNIVTSAEDLAAQNVGLEKLPPRGLRYDMADEYVDLVRKLLSSWEADAVVLDREGGTYTDPTKVHAIDFKGTYYSSRGPLNTVPSPQHRPAFIQAGASPRGRCFAARNADAVIAIANGPKAMKAFRDDIREKAREHGRDPDDVKVLFCVTPVLGETTEEARGKYQRIISSNDFLNDILAQISAISEIDFAEFSLDEPLPRRLETNGEQGSLDQLQQWGSGKTLRQLVQDSAGGLVSSVELVGTPDEVARAMGAVAEEVGGDGFIITTPSLKLNRRFVMEITDGLVPALQRLGLARCDYVTNSLRNHLTEF